jgi:glycerol 2-dehydrogenase (NADP+)
MKVVELSKEEMKTLDGLAAGGKQQRVNTPPWGTDFGFVDWYGVGNKDAPSDARLLAGKA